VVTEKISCGGISALGNIIIHYNSLHFEYDNICSDQNQDLWVHRCAKHACGVLNQYYAKTDESDLYRLALRE
jgi:hypothetical protein